MYEFLWSWLALCRRTDETKAASRHFFDLPAEVRKMIYREFFTSFGTSIANCDCRCPPLFASFFICDGDPHNLQQITRPPSSWVLRTFLGWTKPRSLVEILLTNKQVYSEALPVLYDLTSFDISIDMAMSTWTLLTLENFQLASDHARAWPIPFQRLKYYALLDSLPPSAPKPSPLRHVRHLHLIMHGPSELDSHYWYIYLNAMYTLMRATNFGLNLRSLDIVIGMTGPPATFKHTRMYLTTFANWKTGPAFHKDRNGPQVLVRNVGDPVLDRREAKCWETIIRRIGGRG